MVSIVQFFPGANGEKKLPTTAAEDEAGPFLSEKETVSISVLSRKLLGFQVNHHLNTG